MLVAMAAIFLSKVFVSKIPVSSSRNNFPNLAYMGLRRLAYLKGPPDTLTFIGGSARLRKICQIFTTSYC